MYSFEYDRASQLLKVTQSGLMPPDMAARFAEDFHVQILAALGKSPNFSILIDASQAPVQQLSSFAAAEKLREAFPTPPRTAVVLGSALAKLQANRGVISDIVRTFSSMPEALAWLETPTGSFPVPDSD